MNNMMRTTTALAAFLGFAALILLAPVSSAAATEDVIDALPGDAVSCEDMPLGADCEAPDVYAYFCWNGRCQIFDVGGCFRYICV